MALSKSGKIIDFSTPDIFYIDGIMNEINEYIQDNNLLVCNKYLKGLKLRYYKFNQKYSLKYYNDEKFKKLIQSKIPSNKLGLNLSYYFNRINEDLSMLGNLHTLNLIDCFEIRDVSMLGNLHTLNLNRCYRIRDVSMLGRLYTLDLSYCFSNNIFINAYRTLYIKFNFLFSNNRCRFINTWRTSYIRFKLLFIK